MRDEQKAAILVISSHVVRGAVGNRAAVFALETLGHPVWAMPTLVLPWHPGHGRSTRIAIADEIFAAALADLAGSPARGELSGVLTGYFASAGQVRSAAVLIAGLKAENPELVYLCDPVIGDKSGLYVGEDVAIAIREALLPLADIATPNRSELAWLAGRPIETNRDAAAAARRLGPPHVLVTSALALMAQSTGNLWVTAEDEILAEHRMIDKAPNGPGDLLAALFLSRWLGREKPVDALRLASASVFEILSRTVKSGADELCLPQEAASFASPMAMVQIRSLGAPGRPRKVTPS